MSRYAVPRTNPYTVPRTNPVRLRAGERMKLRRERQAPMEVEVSEESGFDTTSMLLGAAIGAGLVYLLSKASEQAPAQGVMAERLLSDTSDTQNYDQLRPMVLRDGRVMEVLSPIDQPPYIQAGYYLPSQAKNPFRR